MRDGAFLVGKPQCPVFNEEKKIQKLCYPSLRRTKFAPPSVLSKEIKAVVSRHFLKNQ